MSLPHSHFVHTTTHQNQNQNNSPNPGPSPTLELNQAYYDSMKFPPPAQSQPRYPLPNVYRYPQSAAPVQQYLAHPASSYGAQWLGQAPDVQQPLYDQQPQRNQQYIQQYPRPYPQQYAPQSCNFPPQIQRWKLQQQSGSTPVLGWQPYIIYALETPPSPGYDEEQNISMRPIDTAYDIMAFEAAMRGVGCNKTALISIFTNPKYQNPWALHQLKTDYRIRFGRNLADAVTSGTIFIFEFALVALIRGPLNHDVYTLEKALSSGGIDERAINEVLLCRSNTDIRAIVNRYNGAPGRDLLQHIKSKVDSKLFHLYNTIFYGIRAEDAAPVVHAEIDHKISEVQRLIKSPTGTDTTRIVSILASANAAQLRAMSDVYQQKYGRKLQAVIETKFDGRTQDALLRILASATMETAESDAHGLWTLLMETVMEVDIFIYRALRLYWGGNRRLQEAQVAYRKLHDTRLADQLKVSLTGDYKELMIALIGEKSGSMHPYM